MNQHPVLEALRGTVDACVCTTLRKASRVTTQIYDRFLAPSGLTTAQFSLLAALYYARSIAMKKLAQRLVMDRTTLTRNLAPLERRRLVQVEDDPKDRRVRVVAITAAGLDALTSALPRWQKAQRHVLARLGDGAWADLRSALRRSIELDDPTVRRRPLRHSKRA